MRHSFRFNCRRLLYCLCIQVHLILGLGDFERQDGHDPKDFTKIGTMADVAGAANDPIFISHHAMIDNIFEQWLQKNNPTSDDFAPSSEQAMNNTKGHGADDVIVPFIPLYTNIQLFQKASEFGYEYDGYEYDGYEYDGYEYDGAKPGKVSYFVAIILHVITFN